MLAVKLLNNEVAFGNGTTSQFQVYEDGVKITPTSGTIKLYSSGGEVIVDTVALSANGTLLQYVFTADNLDENALNYRIFIEYIVNTITYQANFLLDVVLTPLVLSVVDADLAVKEPTILSDKFATMASYTAQISDAFDKVKTDLRAKERRPDMIIDSSQISELIVLKALDTLFFAFSSQPDEINWAKHVKYRVEYENLFLNLRIVFDCDEDGSIDSQDVLGTVELVR